MTRAHLESLKSEIVAALESMRGPIFTDEMRLTLIVRHPTNPECELIVSADELAEIEKVIERSKVRREL